ncbi:MAG: hypothetical protein M1827_004273 [Pycnora praestabilis]|nr:MAG: hypothetical protein M1827_004273 [Pycnora praestabilis]
MYLGGLRFGVASMISLPLAVVHGYRPEPWLVRRDVCLAEPTIQPIIYEHPVYIRDYISFNTNLVVNDQITIDVTNAPTLLVTLKTSRETFYSFVTPSTSSAGPQSSIPMTTTIASSKTSSTATSTSQFAPLATSFLLKSFYAPQKYKRNGGNNSTIGIVNNLGYLVANGSSVSSCLDASLFTLQDYQMFVGGASPYSAPEGVPYVDFTPSRYVGGISTTFTLLDGSTLQWSNQSFPNTNALFCSPPSGILEAVFSSPIPTECDIVILQANSVPLPIVTPLPTTPSSSSGGGGSGGSGTGGSDGGGTSSGGGSGGGGGGGGSGSNTEASAGGSSTTSSSTSSTAPTPTIVYKVGGYDFIGCFEDGSGGALLQYSMKSSPAALTLDTCASICSNYNYDYMGVSDGAECLCGNTFDLGESVTSPNFYCTTNACDGDPSEGCGGSEFVVIYTFEGDTTSTSSSIPTSTYTGPTTTVSATVGEYLYLGCYSQDTSLNLLNGFQSDQLTIEECAIFCESYGYMGFSEGDACGCGNALYNNPPITETDCDLTCSGNNLENCGGTDSVQLYSKAPGVAPYTGGPPPSLATSTSIL